MATPVEALFDEIAAVCKDHGFHEEVAVAEGINTPAAILAPGESNFVEYNNAGMGGRRNRAGVYKVSIYLAFNAGNRRGSFRQAAQYITPGSDLLNDLNGLTGVEVSACRTAGVLEVGSARYYGVELIADAIRS